MSFKEVVLDKLMQAAFLSLTLTGCASPVQQRPTRALEVPPAESIQEFHAFTQMKITSMRWAAEPPAPGRKSRFDGRCSQPSDYVVSFTMDGRELSLGPLTGSAQHCSQIAWEGGRPARVTYSDGVFTFVLASGEQIRGTYSNGTISFDEGGKSGTCRDEVVFTGGSGRFEGASGKGEDRCSFTEFERAAAGDPMPLETIGSIVLKLQNR